MVFRNILPDIKSREELGLPEVIDDLALLKNGIIFVSGSTGAGKTTTITCMVDTINKHRNCVILMLEKPIEYMHTNIKSIVKQREVGVDVPSFASGVKASLRQDPDVIVVGESMDSDTIETVLQAAETGHLVITSIHPEKTVNRRIFSLASTRQEMNFSTNLCNFEMLYSAESLIKEFLMGIPLWQLELILSSSVNQTSRQSKQISAQSMQSSRTPFLRQAQTFEPVDQIVSQQDQMKMNLIGQKTVGRDIAQRKAFFEFSDVQFASGPGFVKMPYVFWIQGKVGNEGMIEVILEFPERELVVFFLRFRFGAAHYDKPMRPVPVARLVSKPSCLPTAFPEGMITKVLNLFLNRLGHLGYDCVTNLFLVERLDEFVVVKPRVGTDPDSIEVFGNLFSTVRPKFLSSACRMGVARTQDAAPCIPGMPFEANQRLVAGASGLGRVVSYFGSFYSPAKDRQDSRIHIENKAAGRMREIPNMPAQQIVHTDNTLQLRQTDSLQEFSQSRRLREIFQSQQLLETTVVLDRPGIEDTAHSCNHRINHTLQEFYGMIPAVPAIPQNIGLKEPLQLQLSTKPLKNNHSSEVSQGLILEGKCNISYPFGHPAQILLIVRFLQYMSDRGNYSAYSSVMPIFLIVNCGNSPFFQVHATDTVQVFDRILSLFPASQRDFMCTRLSNSIRAIINQKLLPHKSGIGRVIATEVCIGNTAVRRTIRKKDFFQLALIMQTSSKYRMNLMQDSINKLFEQGLISAETCETYTNQGKE